MGETQNGIVSASVKTKNTQSMEPATPPTSNVVSNGNNNTNNSDKIIKTTKQVCKPPQIATMLLYIHTYLHIYIFLC